MASQAPIPIYYRLQSDLLRDIEEGRWKPGQRIPTEREIADDRAVSVGTVKKALLNLVNEGLLYRVQGRGTFVSETAMRRENIRYYHFLKGFDGEQARMNAEVLGLREASASAKVCDALGLRKGAAVFELRRRFLANGRPKVYTVSWLPAGMFPRFDQTPVKELESAMLYLLLEEKYGVPTLSNTELFSAESATAVVARALGVEKGAPVLSIEMISYTHRERPYEYRISHCAAGDLKLMRRL